MADNYLERKMEELRRGRTGTHRSSGIVQGYVSVRIGAKRALVIGAEYKSFALRLSRTGCRVALATDEPSAVDTGLRICPLSDGSALLDRLLNDWYGLDLLLIAADSPLLTPLVERWSAHRVAWPHVSDYGGRLLLTCTSPDEARFGIEAAELLEDTDITATAISIDSADAETLLWLAMPQAAILNRTIISKF